MRRGHESALKLLLAVALLPAAAAVVAAAVGALGGLLERRADTQSFLIGCASYPLVHLAAAGLGGGLRRLLYVLGHELTHAIAAWMSGYKVHRLSVRPDGGHVDVSRSNAFVALAPYVFPLYALGVVLAYRLWLWNGGPRPGGAAHEVFLLALGAALSFHWVFTATALWTVRQPDLAAAGGAVFSLVLIALGNGLIVLGALKCLFPKLVSLEAAAALAARFTAGVWVGLYRLLERAVAAAV
ncbi:MAG: M50 family metallopeptidase [Elusimicrobia bacterium]|nr:M50 family metallopeptidase [Elusimicrobiota bacterium]